MVCSHGANISFRKRVGPGEGIYRLSFLGLLLQIIEGLPCDCQNAHFQAKVFGTVRNAHDTELYVFVMHLVEAVLRLLNVITFDLSQLTFNCHFRQ